LRCRIAERDMSGELAQKIPIVFRSKLLKLHTGTLTR
jgi:hypothetical protein